MHSLLVVLILNTRSIAIKKQKKLCLYYTPLYSLATLSQNADVVGLYALLLVEYLRAFSQSMLISSLANTYVDSMAISFNLNGLHRNT